jgi:sporulation protein YlmC with PRC-barrel domain
MSNHSSKGLLRFGLVLPLLLTILLAACGTPEGPYVLQGSETPVITAEGQPAAPVAGEEPAIEVVEADVAALDTTNAEVVTETVPADQVTAPGTAPATGEGMVAELNLPGVLVGAVYLLNRTVEDLEGNNIGSVSDLIIDLNTGQIYYVILNYGGLLGIGSEDRPLPLAAFGWSADLDLVFNQPEAALENAPVVDDEWPAQFDVATWNGVVGEYWAPSGLLPEIPAEAVAIRARELIDIHAGQVGGPIGTVEDLLLDLDQQRVMYLGIYATSDFYAPDNVLIVPFAAANLEVQVAGGDTTFGLVLLAVEPEVLAAAPYIDRSIFLTVDFIDENLSQEFESYWSQQGYGPAPQ